MKCPLFNKKAFQAILSGVCSPLELHDFVQLCYSLAVPAIRKKIMLGKINLNIMGLKETDIVYDCIADLFQRGDSSTFPQIVRFFQNHLPDVHAASDEMLLMTLRRLVFGKVNTNLIHLYADADPVLGKVLRNMTVALDKTSLFKKHIRFGEAYLLVQGVELLEDLPPIPMEFVQENFARTVVLHDTIPEMMKKLHRLLVTQTEYHRAIRFVPVALLFKEVYSMGWQETEQPTDSQGEAGDIPGLIEDVCRRLDSEMRPTYVESGKKTAETFQRYMLALREMLQAQFVTGSDDRLYFDYLEEQLPGLSKVAYAKEHRVVFEYLAKTAKKRLREDLRQM